MILNEIYFSAAAKIQYVTHVEVKTGLQTQQHVKQ